MAAKVTDVLVNGQWAGEAAACIGGGPSLRGFPWELLGNVKVVGTNIAFKTGVVDVNYIGDLRLLQLLEKEPEGAGQGYWDPGFVRVVSASVEPLFDRGELRAFGQHMVGTASPHPGWSESLEVGVAPGNAGLGAVSLAYLLGARPIYLLGYDLSSSGTKTEQWHQWYPDDWGDGVGNDAKDYDFYYERFDAQIPEHARPYLVLVGSSRLFPRVSRRRVSIERFTARLQEQQRYSWIYNGDESKVEKRVIDAYAVAGNHGKDILDYLLVSCGMQSVVDVGTGRGEFPIEAARRGCLAYGLEFANRPADATEITWLKCFAQDIPLETDAVQWATSFDSMEHLPEYEVDVVLREMNRVSRTGMAFSIAYTPSGCVANGNLHLTVRPEGWWIDQLKRFGRVTRRDKYLIAHKDLSCR